MSDNPGDDIQIELCEPSDNARVVYAARRLAASLGFNVVNQSLIATAASELSTNIIRYAGKGEVILRTVRDSNRTGIEIVALDKGPGIGNIDRAMEEHFSSGNGLGLGLPSVRRIMDEFSITSGPGQGTTIIARKWR